MTTELDRLAAVQRRLRQFSADRDWHTFHDPKNLAMAVASEAGELLAELRWVANSDADQYCRDAIARARIAQEAADVAIALLLFCDRIELDLLDAVERKIELNGRRYPIEAAKGRAERPIARAQDDSDGAAEDR